MHVRKRSVRGGLGRKRRSTQYARGCRVVAGLAGRVVEAEYTHVVDGRCRICGNGALAGHIVLWSSRTKSHDGVEYDRTSRRMEVCVV